jgi:hypothetical protein
MVEGPPICRFVDTPRGGMGSCRPRSCTAHHGRARKLLARLHQRLLGSRRQIGSTSRCHCHRPGLIDGPRLLAAVAERYRRPG